MVDYVIQEAARSIDPVAYGSQTDDAVAYLAAHNLAIDPQGADMRLVAKDGTTTYGKRYNEIREQCIVGVACYRGQFGFPYYENEYQQVPGLPPFYPCTPRFPPGVQTIVLSGPAVVSGILNVRYVCSVTSGNIVITLPFLTTETTVTIFPASGNFAVNTITVIAANPQTLQRPPPNQGLAPVTQYIFGGPSSTSGLGAGDLGVGITWINNGFTGNELVIW
jgi:hypothetical protein